MKNNIIQKNINILKVKNQSIIEKLTGRVESINLDIFFNPHELVIFQELPTESRPVGPAI